jgi:vancomycin resistance protein YoaR
MRRFCFIIALLLVPAATHAASPTLTLRYRHFLFTLRPAASWIAGERQWTYQGHPFAPPASLLVDGDSIPPLPPGVLVTEKQGWDRDAIRAALATTLAPLHRDAGTVTIKKNASGAIVFDGVGLTGRDADLDRATEVTIAALESGAADVFLPVIETQPAISVADPELAKLGIKEVVTIGESNFNNSPPNRIHNIKTGLRKFNGTLIPQGSDFSFDKTLGRVDATTGYLKELVIKGDKTEPDYGGGLCQVSTTAYRGVWEYGFPILKRINHSYMVSHYSPQGTDATVYPPNVDMQFKNDSPGALLIQTHAEGDLAYFIYYGTKDERTSEIIGPFNWGQTSPPPDRTQYTTDLAPGEVKKLGERVPGMKTLWYRFVAQGGKPEKIEPVLSSYEARPHYELIGVEKMPLEFGSGLTLPTVFMED